MFCQIRNKAKEGRSFGNTLKRKEGRSLGNGGSTKQFAITKLELTKSQSPIWQIKRKKTIAKHEISYINMSNKKNQTHMANIEIHILKQNYRFFFILHKPYTTSVSD